MNGVTTYTPQPIREGLPGDKKGKTKIGKARIKLAEGIAEVQEKLGKRLGLPKKKKGKKKNGK